MRLALIFGLFVLVLPVIVEGIAAKKADYV